MLVQIQVSELLKMRNLIAEDLLVDGDQDQILQLRLRHEQTVKRVAMQRG